MNCYGMYVRYKVGRYLRYVVFGSLKVLYMG